MAQRRTRARLVVKLRRRWSLLAAALEEEGGWEDRSLVSRDTTWSGQFGPGGRRRKDRGTKFGRSPGDKL